MMIPLINSRKASIGISYRSKNMKRKFGKSSQLFYFQVRESPAPLNIRTPTDTLDRGGPVARPGGRMARLACRRRFSSWLGISFTTINWLSNWVTNYHQCQDQNDKAMN